MNPSAVRNNEAHCAPKASASLKILVFGAQPFPLSVSRPNVSFCCMSTVAEIEAAIERLQPPEVAELAAWLNEFQQMTQASAEIFAMYDREEASCKRPAGESCG